MKKSKKLQQKQIYPTPQGQSFIHLPCLQCCCFQKQAIQTQSHNNLSRVPLKMLNDSEPIFLSFNKNIASAALKSNRELGWRIWLIARHLDSQCSGRILRSTLKNYLCKDLGMGLPNTQRWIQEALESKFLYICFWDSCNCYYIAEKANVARELGINPYQTGDDASCKVTELFLTQWRNNLKNFCNQAGRSNCNVAHMKIKRKKGKKQSVKVSTG